MKKYLIDMFESERGWGQYYWTEEYDTAIDRQKRLDQVRRDYGGHLEAPDYYVQALKIYEKDI